MTIIPCMLFSPSYSRYHRTPDMHCTPDIAPAAELQRHMHVLKSKNEEKQDKVKYPGYVEEEYLGYVINIRYIYIYIYIYIYPGINESMRVRGYVVRGYSTMVQW